ncbi:hypothetical protein GCM10009608_33300 [Pseudonocardia alaniniphila]
MPARDAPAVVVPVRLQKRIPTIEHPQGPVSEVESAGGQAGDLSQGETLWVFVSEFGSEDGSDDRDFYLQPGPCIIKDDRTWSCGEVYIGENPGDKAHVWVVRADSRRTDEFVRMWQDPLLWDSDTNTPNPENDARRYPALPAGVVASERPLLATRR